MDFNIQGQKQFLFYLRQSLLKVQYHQDEYKSSGDNIHLQLASEAMQEYKNLLACAIKALDNNAKEAPMPEITGILFIDENMQQEMMLELDDIEKSLSN